jgi:hypothetical protein
MNTNSSSQPPDPRELAKNNLLEAVDAAIAAGHNKGTIISVVTEALKVEGGRRRRRRQTKKSKKSQRKSKKSQKKNQ